MNKTIPELDKLFNEIGTYRKSSEFKELFEFVKRFPHIAPYNAMLLHIQKPGSEYVTSAHEWREKFNRNIKAGARPLVILRPFGPVAFVFELGDTEGDDDFPEELINPFRIEGDLSENAYYSLMNSLIYDGISYNEVEHGTLRAGCVQINNTQKRVVISKEKKDIEVKIIFDMVVNRTHPIETRFVTILHELGHVYCGHLGAPIPKWCADRSYLRENEREFEAECICWLICERMGIKNPSAEYLSGYLDQNENIPEISIDTVLKSVAAIELLINGKREPRKEIIISTKEFNQQMSFI